MRRCHTQCPEHPQRITRRMLKAMHGRTYGLTYVKLVTLREEALDLRFRDTPTKRGFLTGDGRAS